MAFSCAEDDTSPPSDEGEGEEKSLKSKVKENLENKLAHAKEIGGEIKESAKSKLNATKEYLDKKTVGQVADDVAERAKNAKNKLADKLKTG